MVARGSTFRFRGPDTDISDIQTLLGANYCLSGIVEIFGKSLTIAVELADTRTQAVVWSERFPGKIDDIHDVRAQIVGATITALELRIPQHEANKARLLDPASLDAWSIYHIGLQHMYRFNRTDNDIAAGHFQRATELDPFFSRAFAARSFTSFQKAFLQNSDDVDRDKDNARRFAEKSLELDPIEPFGSFTLGRSYWLEGDLDGAIEWLQRAISLSPNFAQGHYAHAWTDIMAGRGGEALRRVDRSIKLSPLDPFLYAMQSSRGMAYVLEGDFEKGALWTDKGARSPGAHFLIAAIAAAVHQMNGDSEKAAFWVDNVHSRRKEAIIEHFFTAFPFQGQKIRDMWKNALEQAGI
ncbi:MAG: tetratricopeptide repeat protein [Paracoccaceae bacterium]